MFQFQKLIDIKDNAEKKKAYTRNDEKFALWFPVRVMEDASVKDALDNLFEIYNQLLEENEYDILNGVLQCGDLQTIKKRCESIKSVLTQYLSGDVIKAFKTFSKMMDNCINDFPTKEVENNTDFYRMRRELGLTSKEEFYHLPTNMREKCASERFSIAGYPCFYIGYSQNDCFAEISETGTMISLKLNNNVTINKILDLTYYKEQKVNADLRKFLLAFPVIASCYVIMGNKKREENAKFREEYIIPQMLTSYLKNKKEFDGICYYSVRLEYLNPIDDQKVNDYRNLVLFPNLEDDKQQDTDLMDKFEWKNIQLSIKKKIFVSKDIPN